MKISLIALLLFSNKFGLKHAHFPILKTLQLNKFCTRVLVLVIWYADSCKYPLWHQLFTASPKVTLLSVISIFYSHPLSYVPGLRLQPVYKGDKGIYQWKKHLQSSHFNSLIRTLFFSFLALIDLLLSSKMAT